MSLPPFFYEADNDDPMDVALLQELVSLNLEVSARLNVKRLRPGEYEIEGVKTCLYWQTAELFVRARKPRKKKGTRRRGDDEEPEPGPEGEMPLAVYLRQLANVDTNKLILDPHKDAAAAAEAFAGATGSLPLPAHGAFNRTGSPQPMPLHLMGAHSPMRGGAAAQAPPPRSSTVMEGPTRAI